MKIKKLFIVLAFLFVIPPSFAEGFGGGYKYYDGGFIYTNATLPLSAKKRNEENFVNVSNTNLSSLKQGKSSKTNILGLVEVGDAGVDKAAKNANIKEISYIDVREQTIFIFFKKITTTVYGK